MPRLKLESATGTLSLDEQVDTGVGLQVHSGVSGLGLPDVATQWLEGAGDGATYRGQRALARDIDLPLTVMGRDREDLKARLSRLAIALSGECTLRLVEDDGSSWYTAVRRVGGGQYAYGADTNGVSEVPMVITLRAGDPYWTSSQKRTQEIGRTPGVRGLITRLVHLRLADSVAYGEFDLVNTGDAPAYPVWHITGPGSNFEATSSTGETLRWEGTLLAGQTLTIDTKLGTVVDGTGANRYAELAPAPRMWRVQPGTTTVSAGLEDPTDDSRIVCEWRPRRMLVI